MFKTFLDNWSPWRLRKRLSETEHKMFVAEVAYRRTIPRLLEEGVQFHCSDYMTIIEKPRPEKIAIMLMGTASSYEEAMYMRRLHRVVHEAAYMTHSAGLYDDIKKKLARDISDHIVNHWLGIREN